MSGFYIYDLFRLILNHEFSYYELSPTLLGKNDIIDYGESNQRLSLIKDYETIIVIPSLHLSQINFLGMISRDNYLVWKEKDDKFIAVGKDGKITIWSKTTGK